VGLGGRTARTDSEEIIMRKIIASFNMSLDGVVDHMQEWHFQYFGEDAQAFAYEQLFSCGALLMGRKTYEGFSQAWPNMLEETGEFGVRMNNLPHYVVSSTLEKADWNNTTIIRRGVIKEITKLKEEDGQDVLMYGYGPLAHELLQAGLLDEVRVWLHPILSGHSEPASLLFRDGNKVPLHLAATKQFSTGVIILTYTPAPETAAA
jgi:dihydrofolate reductase